MHRWWRREAAALEEERVARAEATNPWTIRARRQRARGRGDGGDDDAFDAEGSGKTEILDGSVVRGFMYGLYVVNPSGSFTFAIEKVETNIDPWDTTTSNADSGTARDADEGRVRGARRSFSATRPRPGPEDGTR